MILVIILYALCASMFTISKWGLAYAQPIFFVGVRMTVAGLVLWGYSCWRSKQIIFIPRPWLLFVQIILFHIYFTYICDLTALKSITSAESAFLYNLSPFVAALFSYLLFSEKMTLKKWLGLLLGFSSLLPTMLQELQCEQSSSRLMPKIITLIAVASSAYGWVVVRRLVKDYNYSAVFVNGFGMLFGGLLALVTSWYTEVWDPVPVTQWGPFLEATVLIIIVANMLFYNLYGFLLKRYTATFLSFAGFLCPLFAALLGWFCLSEVPSWSMISSFILVSFGLFIFYQEELRQGYIITSSDL